MDKAILKKFAIESRKDLMQRMENKIKAFYIDEEFSKQQSGDVYLLTNNEHNLSLSKEDYNKRELLIKRINELGLEQVVEEAAYTWFNRIVAIRYMEIHDYLPLTKDNQSLGIRVLSSKDNTPDPEIMKFTNLVNPELDIDFKKEKYVELKDDNEKFKYILLLVCKKLGRVIPQVFDGVTDYIDILIPDNLLNESGFVNKIITEVPEENYEQVEIIGWLYQYYNQTEKDRVISAKKVYKKNEIAYATQLFTPDWIVKYMVENSLGRYWVEKTGNLNITEDWKYFIKDNLNIYEQKISPEEITFFDPCCGSGHILVYAFEVLYKIYLSVGYNKNYIPESILKNNLYGLDIDVRAGQLSVLSIILKAREYDRDIFNENVVKKLNVESIQESNNISRAILKIFNSEEIRQKVQNILECFIDAKEVGSLINIDPFNFKSIEKIINESISIFDYELKAKLLPLLKCASILSKKYDVVVTNPPYMGNTYMAKNIKDFVNNNYNIANSDLFSAFILKTISLTQKDGYIGLITPYVWLYIKSYEHLRRNLINKVNLETLVQLEYNAFEAACVPICTFTMKNILSNNNGIYINLSDFRGADNQPIKLLEAINSKECNYKFYRNFQNFSKIPGCSIAYWADDKTLKSFDNKTFELYVETKVGLSTGNNNMFLRNWYEVNIKEIEFDCKKNKNCKWVPLIKGGDFKKWYGNRTEIVFWDNNGEKIKKYDGSTIRNESYYFKETIACSAITSSTNTFRYYPKGSIIDVNFRAMFLKNNELNIFFVLGLLNSKIVNYYCKLLSPTMALNIYDINRIPLLYNKELIVQISIYAKECIKLCKNNWNSYEISWEFEKPQILKGKKIENAINEYNIIISENRKNLKILEEKINEEFIKLYKLEEILEKDIDDEYLTIQKRSSIELVKDLISYAIGCMLGRYSLGEDGIVYAGGEFDENKYKKFKTDSDNIIPITDEAYFDDDIVQRFKQFIEIVFGKETLNENLDFIAETLGKKGTETSEETIRRYFVNDFFNDHCKIYQKRPIYWLLDSGKKNGFKALIYMHRYNENLIPKARLDYLHRVQTTYEKLLSDVNYKLTMDLSMTDKKEALKRQTDLNAKLQEIKEYDEKIAHIANQKISIDLDDGVKVNYEKFKDILAKIK